MPEKGGADVPSKNGKKNHNVTPSKMSEIFEYLETTVTNNYIHKTLLLY